MQPLEIAIVVVMIVQLCSGLVIYRLSYGKWFCKSTCRESTEDRTLVVDVELLQETVDIREGQEITPDIGLGR